MTRRCAAGEGRGEGAGARGVALTRLSIAAHNAGARAPQEVHDSVTHSQKPHNDTYDPA